MEDRDAAEERGEIRQHIEEALPERPVRSFTDGIGRVPAQPARGWRGREQKAKSCEICEGDLWIERGSAVVPCSCRGRRAQRKADSRLRAGGWWRGTSLSFAAPPLAQIATEARGAVENLCLGVKAEKKVAGLWLMGATGTGKSALCAYIAQRLYPSHDAIAGKVGDLLAHLRWLGGAKGEPAVERRMHDLVEVPLLVLDNVDRAIRSRSALVPFALDASCVSHDLIRLARLLRDRHAEMKPTVMTSRADPFECPARLSAVTRTDLVQGLLGTVAGASSPFEDFPEYTEGVLKEAMADVYEAGTLFSLDAAEELAQAA